MTINKFSYSLLLAALFTVVAIGCKKKENVIPEPNNPVAPASPTGGYTKLGNAYATGAGVMVEIYGQEAAFTGYNQIYIALRDSVTNDFVESADVKLAPKMQMATMSHAAPFENPASTTAVNKLFPATVSFIMSSSTRIFLSVCILTRNEAQFIGDCINSVRPVADEILVLDSYSTDNTVAIATAAGCRVMQQSWVDFSFARNTLIAQARGKWILFLDADEELHNAALLKFLTEGAQ